jgi:phthiocerol/phenolphthiocerol synthesis type-I polyketide synthase E
MAELSKRLAELPPDKREALKRLLRSQRMPAQRDEPPPAPVSPGEFTLGDVASPEGATVKASYKQFYDAVSTQLNGSVYGEVSFFLNYGYLPNGQPEFAAVALPEQYINRSSVKLVLELVGDCPVEGRHVLDVGCGRGGTVHVLKTFFARASITGLDLSPAAIAFCRKAHKDPRAAFHEGDAENLPFADASFDIVTNVESSHSYPDIHRFYREVFRVLRPGGHFLYTDTLAVAQMTDCIAYLGHIGFEVERDRDITDNVLRSCDEVAAARVQAFDSRNDRQLMRNFLAVPGSDVYEELRSGRWTYRILKLRKRPEGVRAPWPGPIPEDSHG